MSTEPTAAPESTIDLTPSPRILEMIAEVDLKVYQCLAELIDNAFDELQKAREDPGQEYRVDVTVPPASSASKLSEIVVADNGRGMSIAQMRNALRAGSSGNQAFGTLGLFGMGFNVATARLGQVTKVRSGRRGDDAWTIATIDLGAMLREDTYTVPLSHEPKDPAEHGTTITVQHLKTDIVGRLQRQRELSDTKKLLGRIYSYLLRDPERHTFSGSAMVGGLGLPLYLNGNPVKPYLPCIWDPSRTVTNKGRVVDAVQVIDLPLNDAYACMRCGHWSAYAHDTCVECGSGDIRQRPRRIWGWLGIQRYTHTSDFGVSFIRQGRSITYQDKGLFNYEDEDTVVAEYPVEVGGGRIVGEIHLDHAPVNFRKTDFDRTSRAWTTMVERVRGMSPLKPMKAKELGLPVNESPMSLLFDAFRRNDPGLKTLMPGNGSKALTEQARKWGDEFRKETPGYETDERWYAAAKEHDDLVAGVQPPGDGAGIVDNGWLEDEGLGHLAGGPAGDPAPGTGDNPPLPRPADPVPETVDERFARYREAARPLSELEGRVHIGGANLTLRAYATTGVKFDPADGGSPYFVLRASAGETQLFVATESPLICEFGWDPADAAIVYAIPHVKDLYRVPASHGEVLHEIMEQFPDRKVDAASNRDRGLAIIDDIRERLAPIVMADPPSYWSCLRPASKTGAEDLARVSAPDINWSNATLDGTFVNYVTATGIEDMVRAHPDMLLDGVVFRSTYASWNEQAARDDQVDRLAGLIQDLRRMTSGAKIGSARELSRLALSANILANEMVD